MKDINKDDGKWVDKNRTKKRRNMRKTQLNNGNLHKLTSKGEQNFNLQNNNNKQFIIMI